MKALWRYMEFLLMIRKANCVDCLDLAALSLQVWLHTYATQGLRPNISRYALATFTEHYFEELLKRSSYQNWVYIKDGHLVGFVVVDLESKCPQSRLNDEYLGYEIVTLYISQHFQGKGIGRKLLEKIKTEHGLPFWLSTWVENVQAIGFYLKYGFNIVGEWNFDLDGELHKNHVFLYE